MCVWIIFGVPIAVVLYFMWPLIVLGIFVLLFGGAGRSRSRTGRLTKLDEYS